MCFMLLQVPLLFAIIEDNWILTSTSVFVLLQYHSLVAMENSSPQRENENENVVTILRK